MRKNGDGVRILIADQQPIFRDGLRMLIEAERGYRVVGWADDTVKAVKLTLQLKPHILLLDVDAGYRQVLEALTELEHSSTEVRIIVLATAIEKDQTVEVLRFGARGILPKESTIQLLHKSIRTVMAGQYWLARREVSDVVAALLDLLPPPNRETRRTFFGITPRELEIVALIVAGYTNNDIARKLSLSEQTVKHHLTNIFDKLGVSNRLELALFAVSHRLFNDGRSSTIGNRPKAPKDEKFELRAQPS